MAKQVSITQEHGTVKILTAGGDINGIRNYPLGSLYLLLYENGTTLSLNKLATDETVESFTYADCIEPASTGNLALLRAALARLIGDPAGALAGDTSGSVLARMQSILEVLDTKLGSIDTSNGSVITSANKFVLEDTAPAGSWTSDALAASGMRSCSFVGTIANSALTTGVFQWQGSNDASVWVNAGDASSMSGHGDGAIGFAYTGATSYLFMRLVFTSSGSVQEVTGTIAIVK